MTPVPERRFLLASLALPLVLPLIFFPVGVGFPNSLLGALAVFAFLSLLYGGVPYLIFASVVLRLARRRSVSEILWMWWRLPPVFGAFAALLVGGAMAWISPGQRARMALFFGGLSLASALVMGYAYLALVLGARHVLRRARLLEPERDARN